MPPCLGSRGGRGGRGEQRREWGGASLADAMLGMLAEQGSWNGVLAFQNLFQLDVCFIPVTST